MDKITPKDHPEEFRELCQQQGFEYATTVHHFEKDVLGIYVPVFWGDITITPSEGRK